MAAAAAAAGAFLLAGRALAASFPRFLFFFFSSLPRNEGQYSNDTQSHTALHLFPQHSKSTDPPSL